jgi:hypothetical protein
MLLERGMAVPIAAAATGLKYTLNFFLKKNTMRSHEFVTVLKLPAARG